MAEPVPVDVNSAFVLVLGPAAVAAIVAGIIWWLTHRAPRNGGGGKQ